MKGNVRIVKMYKESVLEDILKHLLFIFEHLQVYDINLIENMPKM